MHVEEMILVLQHVVLDDGILESLATFSEKKVQKLSQRYILVPIWYKLKRHCPSDSFCTFFSECIMQMI